MLTKKASILLSSYANLGPLCYVHASCSPRHPHLPPPSCRHTFTPAHHPHPHVAQQQGRTYAQHHHEELLNWPEAQNPHQTPTPYQILGCSRGDAYSKHRFYALVKLYHPDRCHVSAAIAQLPLHVRLERYRLLVMAHDILSDGEKRRAYDAWGHGWAGHHLTHTHTPNAPWTTDPRNNATWEDWERWHYANNASANEGGEGTNEADARTIQMSNFTFMALLFALVSIGGVMQGTRFTTFNNAAVERRDQIHREASVEYRRSKNATLSGDKHERIRTFMEHRDSTIIGEHSYQRLLPPADTCSADDIRRQ
ncbi:hypothetical protein BDW02DRAFT_570 [Decorospora gaudefroyi]|uniref:J domain-containing protein n=1 Tax=Decorospora gaudefroyi TaxID=184978 RepID=A0A6A5KTQ4_9PLEO|nr:hypothetical protein BDW02DRAFT_570 [Decorospora gaudefroyi]